MITEGQVLDIAKDAIYYIIICSAPVLIISLVVGLIISIFQTVTSIQEQTLTRGRRGVLRGQDARRSVHPQRSREARRRPL